ncbi:hypothetical protein GUITHDRAFT_121465 [Guillardia theta CCMP2712]|uniref:AB hydrolase-1 domain-containing protein n=1 Tax=Guillardia theta (strain CCMP2712) TaxID=905079 RepID=L1I8Z4_GUITC|nr:hypothetical protein GUITHDRAFT_121465 [Guillardia theta CCMP2712]EKX32354.1 hypothetical protein GUITHDRAFT_121465 [Guillardia theta CCMP2712]|eukprot:XP_005819334.1 hypothetical protein GUITHDRAFT_121465 [Guillardia theta CCMP2712]
MSRRPGIGKSTNLASRSPHDFAQDLSHVADELNVCCSTRIVSALTSLQISHFAVVGFSAGASYALAQAQQDARVKAVALVGASVPMVDL